MEKNIRVPLHPHGDPIMPTHFVQPGCTYEQALTANLMFDDSVKRFLRNWTDEHPGLLSIHENPVGTTENTFREGDALHAFFSFSENPLAQLLEQPTIAQHLLRPYSAVYFQPDAYEPLLATFEQRIYNLASHQVPLAVPFRYSSRNRQGQYGQTLGPDDLPPNQWKEDIGVYFGTRRSDQIALTILGRQLRHDAQEASSLPVHVVTDGYMTESLLAVKKIATLLQQEGHQQVHCFIIQRRHAADDRHLGAALLVMNPQHPNKPQRAIFCDTLNPSGIPPWWESFKRKIDAVFPQPDGELPVSGLLEDGGVNLQQLHDGVPIRHQDIDCAFYSASMAQALIRIARENPSLILEGHISDLVAQMTAFMPDYFLEANLPKDPKTVRVTNIIRRWETGTEALTNMLLSQLAESSVHPMQSTGITLPS